MGGPNRVCRVSTTISNVRRLEAIAFRLEVISKNSLLRFSLGSAEPEALPLSLSHSGATT